MNLMHTLPDNLVNDVLSISRSVARVPDDTGKRMRTHQ